MRFELTKAELKKVNSWSKKQDRAFQKEQKKIIPKDDPIYPYLADGPYYGPIGGNLTYSFTPTSIGMVVKVRHVGTKEILDLSDYDTW